MANETKIAIVIREDLAEWQKLNVTAFLSGGVAAQWPELIGEDYRDASGTRYCRCWRSRCWSTPGMRTN